MRFISTLFFVLTALMSSAQLKESILSQLFTTGRAPLMLTDFKVQVCRGGGVLLQQPRNFSDLHLPVYKKEKTLPAPKNVCGGGWPIIFTSENRNDTFKKNEPEVLLLRCGGLPPKEDTVKYQLVCKTGGKTIPFDLSRGIAGKVKSQNDSCVSDRVFEGRRGCNGQRSLTGNNQPMLVLNGVPVDLKDISTINPNDIVGVQILKSAAATAIFGPDGSNGALLITTGMKYKQFVILDSTDKTPVARATAGITMKNGDNTMFYVADEQGVFSSNSPKEFDGLKMTISAVGYESTTRYYNGDISTVDTIWLKRTIKTCGEVVVTGTWCPKRITCSGTITRVGSGTGIAEIADAFTCYPNPARAGAGIYIRFNDPNSSCALRVLSPDGKTLLQQPVSRVQKSLLRVDTDPRWPAGIYFVQLVYENGRIAASGRIIIQ